MWCDRSDLDARFCAHCRGEEPGADVPLEVDDLSAPRAELNPQAAGRGTEPSSCGRNAEPRRPPVLWIVRRCCETCGRATHIDDLLVDDLGDNYCGRCRA